MTYRIIWKKNRQQYTEYKDLKGTQYLIAWLEDNADAGFELVNITLAEE